MITKNEDKRAGEGVLLRLYVDEAATHDGVLLWEWLLRQGNRLGLQGGSAFRTIGGFGRRHTIHESRFFELAGSSAIEVEFVATVDEEQRLLTLIRAERLRIFCARIPARFGVINPDSDDTAGEGSASGP